MKSRHLHGFAVALATLLVVADATAQMPGGGRRGGGMGGMSSEMQGRHDRGERKAPVPVASDPFSALERELPSLNVDLMLRPDQLEHWRLFERDVRDVAEMGRAQRRRLLSLREAQGRPSGMAMISSLADEERTRAAKATNLQRHFESLYGALDEKQKAMLDRRVVQSQVEPLGR